MKFKLKKKSFCDEATLSSKSETRCHKLELKIGLQIKGRVAISLSSKADPLTYQNYESWKVLIEAVLNKVKCRVNLDADSEVIEKYEANYQFDSDCANDKESFLSVDAYDQVTQRKRFGTSATCTKFDQEATQVSPNAEACMTLNIFSTIEKWSLKEISCRSKLSLRESNFNKVEIVPQETENQQLIVSVADAWNIMERQGIKVLLNSL